MTEPVLRVEHLSTHIVTRSGTAKAVDDVSFAIEQGQIMGLVGESGSGKSMTGYSLIGLVDPPCRIVSGRVLLKGRDLLTLPPRELRRVRGGRIAMIFQDPMMTLDPVLRIDTQMVEAVTAHERVTRQVARDRALHALERVGIASPQTRLASYPHQLSGGMRQRVAIAIALLNNPEIIICDEPTTALDVTIQGQILFEMQKLCSETGAALLWITHDLAVIAGLADRVAVMYAGRIVESGSVDEILDTPRHPYTAGLIASTPASQSARLGPGERLAQIPGLAPSLFNLGRGCAFRARCANRDAKCDEDPPQLVEGSGRAFRCFHPMMAICS